MLEKVESQDAQSKNKKKKKWTLPPSINLEKLNMLIYT